MPVAQPPLDLAFEPERIARLVRRVDQNDAVRSDHDAMIRALQTGFDEDVGGQLLHLFFDFQSTDRALNLLLRTVGAIHESPLP